MQKFHSRVSLTRLCSFSSPAFAKKNLEISALLWFNYNL